jgi:hypothetical protein
MDLHDLNLQFLSNIQQFRRQIDNALILGGLCALDLLLAWKMEVVYWCLLLCFLSPYLQL